MDELVNYISREIGSSPFPYKFTGSPDIKEATNCLMWKLPPPTDEDKTLLQLDSELTEKLYELIKESPTSPEIQELKIKQAKLLEGVKFSKKHGYSIYTPNDLIVFDKRKGIRKEWWNLRNYAKENQCCLFLGYSSDTSDLQKIADEIILMPVPDQYEYIRLHSTRGNNYQIETEEIIRRITRISEVAETTILFATGASIELLLEYSSGQENMSDIRYQLRKMCPDIEELTTSLKAGRVYIWWD